MGVYGYGARGLCGLRFQFVEQRARDSGQVGEVLPRYRDFESVGGLITEPYGVVQDPVLVPPQQADGVQQRRQIGRLRRFQVDIFAGRELPQDSLGR